MALRGSAWKVGRSAPALSTLVALTLIIAAVVQPAVPSSASGPAVASGVSEPAVRSNASDLLAPTTAPGRVVAAYGQLPLSFEANHGQTDARVDFLARGSGYTLFLTGSEA